MFTQSHGTIFSELCCDGFGGAQNTCIPAVVSGGGHVVSVKGYLLVVQLPFFVTCSHIGVKGCSYENCCRNCDFGRLFVFLLFLMNVLRGYRRF